jgi:hypothetical protein
VSIASLAARVARRSRGRGGYLPRLGWTSSAPSGLVAVVRRSGPALQRAGQVNVDGQPGQPPAVPGAPPDQLSFAAPSICLEGLGVPCDTTTVVLGESRRARDS